MFERPLRFNESQAWVSHHPTVGMPFHPAYTTFVFSANIKNPRNAYRGFKTFDMPPLGLLHYPVEDKGSKITEEKTSESAP